MSSPNREEQPNHPPHHIPWPPAAPNSPYGTLCVALEERRVWNASENYQTDVPAAVNPTIQPPRRIRASCSLPRYYERVDRRDAERTALVMGIRRRYQEMETLRREPPTDQFDNGSSRMGTYMAAMHRVIRLWDEIADLQTRLRICVLEDGHTWRCQHSPGECPVLGLGFLFMSPTNAGHLSPPPRSYSSPYLGQGQYTRTVPATACPTLDSPQPPRAYSAPPVTCMMPLQAGYLPLRTRFFVPQLNPPNAMPFRNDIAATPSYSPSVPTPQQRYTAMPNIVMNTQPTFQRIATPYYPPPPPPLPQEPAAHSAPDFELDSNGNDRYCINDFRPWALRGPPYLAESVKFIRKYENAGVDPEMQLQSQDFIRFLEICPRHQDGPTCGLLALSLIGNLVRSMTVENNILPLARALGYTFQGEMFSATHMYDLASHLLGNVCDVLLLSGNPLIEQAEHIFRMLTEEHTVLLVPYDNDSNNAPGLHRGHKAHWCAVVGSSQFRGQRFYCAAQGKSKTLAFWRHDVLAFSNSQLLEPNPELVATGLFKIGNLAEDLCGQIVLIQFRVGVRLSLAYCTDATTMTDYFNHLTENLPPPPQ